MEKKVVLALGGGGVKGAAHLGVMRALKHEGVQIQAIAGSSAGAMIGSFYAAGFPLEEIETRLMQLDQDRLFQRKQGDGPAFLGLAGTAALIGGFLGDLKFEDLQIPFAVTATNLDTGQQEIFRSGRVLEAVLASIAVPGIFPPQHLDGKVLIDGGVLCPVPVQLARTLAPQLPVIAVALSPTLEEWGNLPTKRGLFSSLPLVGNLAERLVWAQALEIFTRAVDLGGLMVTDLRLDVEKPDILVRPEVHHVGLIEKIDVSKLAMAGELALLKQLPELQRVLYQQNWSRSLTIGLAQWIGKNYPGLCDEVIRQRYGT